MNSSINLKIFLGIIYLVIFSVGIYFLLSVVDIKDLTNYEFINSLANLVFKSALLENRSNFYHPPNNCPNYFKKCPCSDRL